MFESFDNDLAALQEARWLVQRAGAAAKDLARIESAEARRIAEEVCRACEARAEHYAKWAVEETGIGRTEDKVFKNLLASRDLMSFYRDTQLGGIRVDAARNMLLVARPAGVVMGLIASTSPIATLYFKILSCLLTRNAIILSPHPLALECSIDASEYLRSVAREAGAPADAIQIQKKPTLEATHWLMRSSGVNLILATGGSPMVRAAYSSGNPALGVGPGNVPVYVDASADLDLATSEMMEAKAFDYGSGCSTPSAVFVHRQVASDYADRLKRSGAYFCNAEEQRKLENFAFPQGHINTKMVARSAEWIAAQAGIGNGCGMRILVGSFDEIGRNVVMAQEKLSPILGFKVVADRDHAISDAQAMLAVSGAGHTSGIFSEDVETIALWGAALDVNRTVVNKGSSMGVVGNGNYLAPTFTVGTGFAGKSSISENVGPEHLINWKKIAFPKTMAAPNLRIPAYREANLSSTNQESGANVGAIVKAVLAAVANTRI